jgi:hypothetical protein
MSLFYLSADCGNCDNEIFYGPCKTTIEHAGDPVIPYDFAAQNDFYCERCGASNYTGDFEIFTEKEEGGTGLR